MLGILMFIVVLLAIFVWPGIATIALIAFIAYNLIRLLVDCFANKRVMISAVIFNGIPLITGIALLAWAWN